MSEEQKKAAGVFLEADQAAAVAAIQAAAEKARARIREDHDLKLAAAIARVDQMERAQVTGLNTGFDAFRGDVGPVVIGYDKGEGVSAGSETEFLVVGAA